jgi:hypothetical protein
MSDEDQARRKASRGPTASIARRNLEPAEGDTAPADPEPDVGAGCGERVSVDIGSATLAVDRRRRNALGRAAQPGMVGAAGEAEASCQRRTSRRLRPERGV